MSYLPSNLVHNPQSPQNGHKMTWTRTNSSNEMNEKVTWIVEDERWRCEDESQSRWLAERNEKWRAGYGVHGHGELASILFFAPDIMAPAVAISSFGPAILILVISFFNFPIQKF